MSQTADKEIEPYTLLRAALSLFKKAPDDLGVEQLQQVQRQAETNST